VYPPPALKLELANVGVERYVAAFLWGSTKPVKA